MFSRNGEDMVDSQAVELGSFSRLFLRIDFVDNEEDGLARTTKKTDKFLIGSCDAGSAVNDEKHERRAFNRNFGLFKNALRDFCLFAWNDAAGVYNFVGASVPTDNSVNSVARNARLVGNDRPALANKA